MMRFRPNILGQAQSSLGPQNKGSKTKRSCGAVTHSYSNAVVPSLPHPPSPPIQTKHQSPPHAPFPSIHSNPSPNPNPRHKVLPPLEHLAIIFGTLTLPTAIDASASASSNTTHRCYYNTCFQFSEGSASICCHNLTSTIGLWGRKSVFLLGISFPGNLVADSWRLSDGVFKIPIAYFVPVRIQFHSSWFGLFE
ncbi:hypothetical protein GBA52_001854 [Prunus armeniaca]|nr:hypothetical protein GBA52_001854 [Prunus armeniaca]